MGYGLGQDLGLDICMESKGKDKDNVTEADA